VVGAVLIAAVYVDQQRRTAALRGGGPRALSLFGRLTSKQGVPVAAAPRELPRPAPQDSRPDRSAV
jgi:hypothetical protein